MTCRRLTALLGLLLAGAAWGAEVWDVARPDYRWSFPQDHWARPGYQLTIFRIGLSRERPGLDSGWAARNLVMGHAAVSDLGGGRHRFSELLYREVPLL